MVCIVMSSAFASALLLFGSYVIVSSQITETILTPDGTVTEGHPESCPGSSSPGSSSPGTAGPWTGVRFAEVETTPAECSGGIRCGFQVYDRDTGLPSMPFISYCGCPEGTVCLPDGDDKIQRFIYYKCKTAPVTEIAPVPSEEAEGSQNSSVVEDTTQLSN